MSALKEIAESSLMTGEPCERPWCYGWHTLYMHTVFLSLWSSMQITLALCTLSARAKLGLQRRWQRTRTRVWPTMQTSASLLFLLPQRQMVQCCLIRLWWQARGRVAFQPFLVLFTTPAHSVRGMHAPSILAHLSVSGYQLSSASSSTCGASVQLPTIGVMMSHRGHM